MKKSLWSKTVDELLEKSLLSKDEKKEMLKAFKNAQALKKIAARNLEHGYPGTATELWSELLTTANDALAQLTIITASGGLVLVLDPKTGKYSYSRDELPIQNELNILSGNND